MESVFLQVLDLSIAGGWVILAVLAVRLLLYKAPKVYSYALWAAVGFRLVSSASVSSLLSLFNLRPFRSVTQATGELQFVPQDIGFEAVPQIGTGVPAADTAINSSLPAATPEVSVNPMQIVIFVGMIIWLIGMALMTAVSIVGYVRLRRQLRFSIRKEGNVWQCETVRSPFLMGIIKPKIYLPYGLDSQTESYILAHENYHIKRCDHIVKLFAYALLTVHWFNPLCHLAFRLMNRDMEMSCDEHVLNRNEIPTSQYSLSLLTIATNRRFPAATPLAFAETGVKERMINVLNWKKPKKWVSVVAVLVCVILLISCATNPKVNEPKVDDPTLLEFPGVKWGMTPEEVKTALNLTEEQIESQTYSDASLATDNCYLTVVNFPYFNKTTSSVGFQFRNSNGNGYRLYQIILYLDEKTDMEQVNATLTKIYGEGTGEYYLYYAIDGNGALKEGKRSGDSTLRFLINNPPNGSSNKAIRDAVQSIVNDPEYTVQHWVASAKGTDILTADEQELIVQYWENNEVSNRETVLQWLEKAPPVTVFTANRSLSAALDQAQNTSTLATDNQVVYNADVLLYYTELIEYVSGDITPTEPTEKVKTTKSPDLPFLFFPEASWGLQPYQIKEIFELTEDQIITEGQSDDRYILHVKDISFFDSEVASAKFSFLTTDVGQHLLAEVTLFYPEETDMAEVKNALTEFYIEPKEGNGFTRYRMTDAGTVESYIDYGIIDPDNPGSSEATAWWESSVTLINVLADNIQEKMLKRAILLNKNDESMREVVLEYLDKEPSMYICCTDNSNLADLNSPYCTRNVVFFNALEYIQIIISYM